MTLAVTTQLIGDTLLLLAFTLGLGAVTVIDLHGFLGRKSSYWTEATTRTHKVTKPLIWLGSIALLSGSIVSYGFGWQLVVSLLLMLNGLYLTFGVSRFLLEREKMGKAAELLPVNWQIGITISFILSFLGWWSSFVGFLLMLQGR